MRYVISSFGIWWMWIQEKSKVKHTLVQALRLCTGHTAHRGSGGIALLFLDHSTRRGWGVSVMPWPLFTPGKDLVPFIQEARWAPRPVWTGAENLAPTGIRSLERPAHSQSLYRLHYPAHEDRRDKLECKGNHRECVKEICGWFVSKVLKWVYWEHLCKPTAKEDTSECKVKVKWSRYRPGVTQRVGRDIALLFHDRGTRWGWAVGSMPRPQFTPGKDPVPILQEAG